jgi:hypothetical protein
MRERTGRGQGHIKEGEDRATARRARTEEDRATADNATPCIVIK